MSCYLIKVRGDECPDKNINPETWENGKFKLIEYFKNLNIIEDSKDAKALIWLNESTRKMDGQISVNGFGLSAYATISDVDVINGTFKLKNIATFSKHLNLNNFLSLQHTGTFKEAYRSQRVRVRELTETDLLNIIAAYSNLSK